MLNIRGQFTCKQDFRQYLTHCTVLNATCYLLMSFATDCMAACDVDEDYEFYESIFWAAKGLLPIGDGSDKETVLNGLISKIIDYEFCA